ncbi:hypothetical protein C1645_837155 [Glomus cerebriforme]|uniref:F-box domain-containing protein n=1 Tax=Glomus cerebriforme TaxID=658196 RepID=A0A397SBG0_9GLOM|nr:hypothetical protein C1645_837155 [Glomus cerebriforme]
MSQLPADCLNEIFEYLEDEVISNSCLSINSLWCEVSVRILWRNVRNCKTLIACLPNESKEILHKNKIIISTLNTKPPYFNYISLIKTFSIHNIDCIIKNVLQNYQSITPQSLNHKKYIVAKEIFKSLMNQISLRELYFNSYKIIDIPSITFTSYPGAKDCLKCLSRLSCRSDIYSEFFYQLSQICHHIQYLGIIFEKVISNGLKDLISVQKNLKHLYIMQSYDCEDLTDIYHSITKLPNTLIKFELYGGRHNIPLLFISKFTNLQELVLSFYIYNDSFEYFKKLQYVTFPHLKILKFKFSYPRYELIKFLENNGKNLKELYIRHSYGDNSLNLAIAKFCPNLRKYFTIFNNELESLKTIFISCKYLESIEIWCGDEYLNDKEVLELIVKFSPRNFCELKIYYVIDARSEILPEELEKFFIDWKNRIPQKSLSFIITKGSRAKSLEIKLENMKVIEKYKKLGIIKKFDC